jgi:hypothetical protein
VQLNAHYEQVGFTRTARERSRKLPSQQGFASGGRLRAVADSGSRVITSVTFAEQDDLLRSSNISNTKK